MRVPFLDLKTQHESIRGEIADAINGVLESGQYILGPNVTMFENAFAAIHSNDPSAPPHCIGTNNGTSALHLALWSLGIKRGDEVIVPVNTFIATAEAVLLCGATPIFVDHDEYFTIDPEEIELRITGRTRAIIAVHLYGQLANMPAIRSIADRHGLLLIEDAAQAHLASYAGRKAGGWGDATAFSFYPGKNLGAYGEAGAVLATDASLADTMRRLRDHGSEKKYWHIVAGHNYRLEALQAAILNAKLPHLDAWTEARRANADYYREVFQNIPLVELPKAREGARHVYHLFVIQTPNRDRVQEYLQQKEISTGLHYPIPLHLQPCFAYLGYKEGAFPRAEKSAKQILSLPMYPELTKEQVEFVAQSIRECYASKGERSR
jgi:dTDP-4-amino-4,6-dideoxygalactose transaminase